MNLKKLFPISYEKSLLIGIVKYIVIAIIAGLLIWLATFMTGWIPVVGGFVGWTLGIVGSVVEVYVVVGIVLSILVDLKIVK